MRVPVIIDNIKIESEYIDGKIVTIAVTDSLQPGIAINITLTFEEMVNLSTIFAGITMHMEQKR